MIYTKIPLVLYSFVLHESQSVLKDDESNMIPVD